MLRCREPMLLLHLPPYFILWWDIATICLNSNFSSRAVCCGLAFLFGTKFPQSSLIFLWANATICLNSNFSSCAVCCGLAFFCKKHPPSSRVSKTIPIKQEGAPHAVIGIENDTQPIKGRAIYCHWVSFCAILSYYIPPKTSILAEISQIFAKNGFGKGFALQKCENEN